MSRPTRARSCTGKIANASRDSALAHIARLARLGAAPHRFEPYRCRHCSTTATPVWHVGHRRSRR